MVRKSAPPEKIVATPMLGCINQLARQLLVTASYHTDTCDSAFGRRYRTFEPEGPFNRSAMRWRASRAWVCTVSRSGSAGNPVLWAICFLRSCPLSDGKRITLESDKFSLETNRKDARNSINRCSIEIRFTRSELRLTHASTLCPEKKWTPK